MGIYCKCYILRDSPSLIFLFYFLATFSISFIINVGYFIDCNMDIGFYWLMFD